MQDLIINEELKSLLPSLSTEEFAGLEESILKDGCLCDLIVWDGILIDGHHRYEICRKHQKPYGIKNVVLGGLEEAKYWAWNNQDKRRNLTPFQRAEIAMRLKEAVAAKAKERQRASGGDRTSTNGKAVPQILAEPLGGKETRQELAGIAQMSHTTFNKAEYIAEHADEETKDKLRQAKNGTTINGEYNRLRAEEKSAVSDSKPVDEPSGDETYPEPPCPNKHVKYFPKTTLKLIPQETPQVLLGNLFTHFRKGFVEEMVVMAMEMIQHKLGDSAVRKIMRQLNKKYDK